MVESLPEAIDTVPKPRRRLRHWGEEFLEYNSDNRLTLFIDGTISESLTASWLLPNAGGSEIERRTVH